MKVYYAHCMAIYDTPQETRDLALLKELGFQPINPNSKEHQPGWKQHGMQYFDRIVDKFDAVAFRANPDGSIPSGVFYEIELAGRRGMPVFELPSGLSRRALTLPQTVAYLREIGQR